MTYKCAFLGCGPRSRAHAQAYEHVPLGERVACCDLDADRLRSYADAFGIPGRYHDLETMLEKERPDLVHLVTPPTLRVGLLTQLVEAGVPAVVVEKPVCIGADDYKALRQLETSSRTKIAVNHQLRHHPRVLSLLDEVRAGSIGQIRFLDASAVYPMSGQGVHVLDLLYAFAGSPEVQTVFGASAGYDDINGTHPSARSAESLITFRNQVRGCLQAGQGAPMLGTGLEAWKHKRIAVYGTHGFVHWWMWGWERSLPNGQIERGHHDYGTEDVLGQAGLTNTMLAWLDGGEAAPTNLATSLDEWLVILAGYLSTVEARPVDMPFDPPDDLLQRFLAFVGAEGTGNGRL